MGGGILDGLRDLPPLQRIQRPPRNTYRRYDKFTTFFDLQTAWALGQAHASDNFTRNQAVVRMGLEADTWMCYKSYPAYLPLLWIHSAKDLANAATIA